jgi:hypothetical protein
VVSEEKIFEKVLQTDDGRQVMAIAHTGELKRAITPKWITGFTSKLQVV